MEEFDRIFDIEMVLKNEGNTWIEMIPKVFEIAKNESNAELKALYEDCLTCTSEGNYIPIK